MILGKHISCPAPDCNLKQGEQKPKSGVINIQVLETFYRSTCS